MSYDILLPAFLAGLLVLATHVPLGQQVLARGIVFIDLAIALLVAFAIIRFAVYVLRKVLPEEKQCSSSVGRVYSNSREEVLWCSCDLPRRKWKETTWKDSLTLTYSLSPQWRTMSRLHSG